MDTDVGARLDWARLLRQLLAQRRSPRPDYRWPSRRFPARVGQVPGRRRRPSRPAVLACIDTSGSMSGESLDRIAGEVDELLRHARVTVVESDAAIHRVYSPIDRLGPLVGGGDTDFVPVFEEAERMRHIEALIYFTDGKGNPEQVSTRLPTLWVLTHDDPFQADRGWIVRIPTQT